MIADLPPGWSWACLNECCDVTLGQSPPGSSYNDGGNGSPFFQGKAEFGDRFPSIRKWTTEPKKHASAGSVLVSVRAPVGPTNVAHVDCAIGRGLAALRPLGDISTEYLLWAMRTSEDDLASEAAGSTFEAITGHQLRSHRVAVAPLAEQKRIVAAIEEHFSRLDAAESSLRQALQRLDVLRSAVLIDAFHAHRDLPPAWRASTIGDVADVQLGRQRSPQHHTGEQMRPYLRSANVTWNGISLNDVKAMNFDDADFEKYRLEPGDLLLNEASGSPMKWASPPSGMARSGTAASRTHSFAFGRMESL